MATMNRRKWIRDRAEQSIEPVAFQRASLALRGRCRRHGVEYPLNVLRRGIVTANGCPHCRMAPR
ncbi:hypothetical protein ACQKIE_10080 [Luteibacter sp. NPDC031894]|uniref:hypothetical protein n=1 Tax=Luteibacter sp. NPDC031894 TaxID=3390572 RepID=UPI003D02AC50